MIGWQRRIKELREKITSNPIFLESRKNAEVMACKLIKTKMGQFSETDFNRFCDLCNTEIVPSDPTSDQLRSQETRTRFQLSFIGQNRKLMIQSLKECNRWIEVLWHARESDIFTVLDQFWRQRQVKGAGTGFPTMILYLRDSQRFNVWLPFLAKGLTGIIGKDLPMGHTAENYEFYNEACKSLKDKFENLQPQEIDYILYRVGIGQ